MLLQYYLSKQKLTQLAKYENCVIIQHQTGFYKDIKILLSKNQIFPNNEYIHITACDAVSSQNCNLPMTGTKFTKMQLYIELFFLFP